MSCINHNTNLNIGRRLTVIIATKDRPDDARRAVESVFKQSEPCEILVIDDGSKQPTELPALSVSMVRQEISLGCVKTRQIASRAVTTPYLAYLDDDATLVDPRTLKCAVDALEQYEELAAIALPYLELTDQSLHCIARTSNEPWITQSFTGLGSVIRVSDFWVVGGFKEHLIQQGEERDLCIRWLDRGKYVGLIPVEPMVHKSSPVRNWRNMHFYGRRNDVLFAWENLPTRPGLWLFARAVWRTIWHGSRDRGLIAMAQGLSSAVRTIKRKQSRRSPVATETYRRWQQLSEVRPQSGALQSLEQAKVV